MTTPKMIRGRGRRKEPEGLKAEGFVSYYGELLGQVIMVGYYGRL